MVVAPRITWLFVSTSPADVSTIPVPAAEAPAYARLVSITTTPVPTAAACARAKAKRATTAAASAARATTRAKRVRPAAFMPTLFPPNLGPDLEVPLTLLRDRSYPDRGGTPQATQKEGSPARSRRRRGVPARRGGSVRGGRPLLLRRDPRGRPGRARPRRPAAARRLARVGTRHGERRHARAARPPRPPANAGH